MGEGYSAERAEALLREWTANESLADHLAHWQRECPSDLRPFVAQLAALFGVEL